MDVADHEGMPLHLGWRAILYLPWLGLEIVKANIDVAKRVVQPKPDISPELFETPASQQSDLGQVIYANSITLTPGTITTGVSGNEFEIHALRAADLETDEEQAMDVRCSKVEKG